MATFTSLPVNVDMPYENSSTEAVPGPRCGSGATGTIRSLTRSAISHVDGLLTTGSLPQSTNTVVHANASSTNTVLSSGLPPVTTNSSQTYRYATAIPSVTTYASKSARNNVECLWTFILCIVFLPLFF